MPWKDPEKKKQYDKKYRLENKERINQIALKHYHQNKEKYHLKYLMNRPKQILKQLESKKLALGIINPNLQCQRCGCSDLRFLEKNHKNGGGGQEFREKNHTIRNEHIINGKRKTDDLELLCRPCNHIHFLELKYGFTGLKVVWEKPQNLIIPNV